MFYSNSTMGIFFATAHVEVLIWPLLQKLKYTLTRSRLPFGSLPGIMALLESHLFLFFLPSPPSLPLSFLPYSSFLYFFFTYSLPPPLLFLAMEISDTWSGFCWNHQSPAFHFPLTNTWASSSSPPVFQLLLIDLMGDSISERSPMSRNWRKHRW